MVLHGYEEVEHTADIAIRVWGEDFQTLLRQAASGLYDLVGVVYHDDSPVEKGFLIPQGSSETILVDFLSELLYFAEQERQAYEAFSFESSNEDLIVHASGYTILSQERQIKAVTFHNLNVVNSDRGIEATITFDV